jgi:hypothetical protein
MRILLTLALLCGCGCASDPTKPVSLASDLVTLIRNPNGCVTECGMTAPQVGDCDDLRAYEREIVKGLGASQNDYTEAKVCAALKGYTLKAAERRPLDEMLCAEHGGWVAFFTVGGYFCAEGYTDIKTKTITVKSIEWRKGPLAHEVVHAVEGKPGHCRWASLPLRIAVSELMGEPDQSQPEASLCSP